MSNKAPNITLPQGGGAQSGLGEKFSPDLFTGTGNFSVPVAVPSGRNGLQPQLSIGYSSGNGNSPFGLGWNLGIPGVSRKTSRGIPVYDDDQDVFILSGTEDLVQVKQTTANGHQKTYYRPRTEGLYSRIVHHKKTSGENYWEVCSKDGLKSFYGNPDETGNYSCVLANPLLRNSIFAWRLFKTVDSFGNHIMYHYDRDIVTNGIHIYDQLYLSHITYVDYPDGENTSYLVRVQFNYEERPDAFSEYKQGFEVRTAKRCSSIETYTLPKEANLPEGYNIDNAWYESWDCFRVKVKSYSFTYSDQDAKELQPLNGLSQLRKVEVNGYDLNDPESMEPMPPLVFRYSLFDPNRRDFFPVKGSDLPSYGLGSNNIELVDLTGDGLPDILQLDGIARWWKNKGNGTFEASRMMDDAPAGLRLDDPDVQMIDANGDGRADLLVNKPGLCGYFSTRFGGTWDRSTFRKYEYAPSFSFTDPEVKLIDLDGDGVTDVLRNGSRFECFYNHPDLGFYKTSVTDKKQLDDFPDISFTDPRIRLADMTGDGMQDIVLIHSGSVAYWPNLGYGRFGKKITMTHSPRFPNGFNPAKILLGDVDGDGQADLIYVDHNRVTLWVNKSGNGWSKASEIIGTPSMSDADSVRLTDLKGSGVSGILWSSVYNSSSFSKMFYLDFTGGNKPYLLQEMDNNTGSITRVEYSSSIKYYLEDTMITSKRWKSELPFPVLVVSKVEVIDQVSRGKLSSVFSYHHGYWDGVEREFRGFGRVEQRDTESFAAYNDSSLVPLVNPGHYDPFDQVSSVHYTPPTETRSWFHQGALGDVFSGWYENDYSHEYWQGDPDMLERNKLLRSGELAMFAGLPGRAKRDALRTMRGTLLRSELYALDGTPLQDRPYTVTESVGFVRKDYEPVEPVKDEFKYASGYIFFPYSLGQRSTQWERGNDPMSSFGFSWEYDAYGQATRQLSVAVSRGIDPLTGDEFTVASGKFRPTTLAAEKYLATFSRGFYIYKGNISDDEAAGGIYMMNRNKQAIAYDCTYGGTALPVITFQESVAGGFHVGKVIAHSLNYYDGAAYEGLEFGLLGNYGSLVRTETLISTDEIYDESYYSLPETLQDSPSWSDEYPEAFREQYPVRGGYLYHTSGDYTPGYYVRGAANYYDFQDGGGKGLMLGSKDPFGAETVIAYDDYLLLPISVTNIVSESELYVTTSEYDYRVLQPQRVTDINENISVFDFSPLGLLRATALIGKGEEGDYKGSGSGFYNLYEPSSRMEYDFMSFMQIGTPVWVKTIKREYHYQQEINDDTIISMEYSDGFGRLVQTRTQAEDVIFGNKPEERVMGNSGLPATQGSNANASGVERDPEALINVVVSGWQIYNNKGKVVEKYEPFFHQGFDYVPYLLEVFGPESICLESNAVYTTINTAGSSYMWEVSGAEIISGQGTPQITLSWGSPGSKNIRVTETTTSGRSYTADFNTTVYPLPDPSFSSSAAVTCNNVPVTLSANNYYPVYTYTWSLGSGAIVLEEAEDYVIVMWLTAGTRAVSVTVGTSACTFTPLTVGGSIGVLDPASPSLSASPMTICTGMALTISANDYDPTYTYTWNTDGGIIISQIDDTVTVEWTTAGAKVVNVQVDNGGCTVNPPVPIVITVENAPAPSLSASAFVTCENLPVTISANDYDPSFSYSWNLDSGAVIVNQADDWVEVLWTAPGIKNVWVQVINTGCTVNASPLPIEVCATPAPVITGSTSPPINTPIPYSVVSPVSGNSYIWALSPNGILLSGQGTDTIVVEWTTALSVEQVDVYEDNGACGTNASPYPVVPV
jgi:hypothetical protein